MAAHNPPAPASGHQSGHHDEHETPIKTPRQLITVVVLAFVIPTISIILLAKFVASGDRTGAGTAAMTDEAITARIRPVAGFELRAADGGASARGGEEVYKAVCSACHSAGVAGAPKSGDAGSWAPRIATGLKSLVTSALKGKGAMPAQGGGDYSDFEIERAVVFMANQAGGKFEEPKPAGDAKKE